MSSEQTGTGQTPQAGSIDFAALAENAADVVLQTDAGGAIEWASRGAASLAATDATALAGQACVALVHPEDRAGLTIALRGALSAGRSRTDVRLGSAAAGWVWHSVVIHRMTTEAGPKLAVSGRSAEPRRDAGPVGSSGGRLPAGSNLSGVLTQADASGSAPTVLLIDDEPLVRATAARMLRDLGYDVVQAANAGAVLALGDEELARVALLLIDIVMPGIGGVQVAAMLHDRRPGLPTVFMSGYVPAGGLEAEFLRPATSFLTKPFTRHELALALETLLGDGAAPGPANTES